MNEAFVFGRDHEPLLLGIRPPFIGMLELVARSNPILWLLGFGCLHELFLTPRYLRFADFVE
jgi:hypothetical protein